MKLSSRLWTHSHTVIVVHVTMSWTTLFSTFAAGAFSGFAGQGLVRHHGGGGGLDGVGGGVLEEGEALEFGGGEVPAVEAGEGAASGAEGGACFEEGGFVGGTGGGGVSGGGGRGRGGGIFEAEGGVFAGGGAAEGEGEGAGAEEGGAGHGRCLASGWREG